MLPEMLPTGVPRLLVQRAVRREVAERARRRLFPGSARGFEELNKRLRGGGLAESLFGLLAVLLRRAQFRVAGGWGGALSCCGTMK